MREEITRLASSILRSTAIKKILNGEFDKALSFDVESIVKQYNSGDISILFSEDLKAFLKDENNYSYDLFESITLIHKFLPCRKAFNRDVQDKKDEINYVPRDYYYEDCYRSMSYEKVQQAFDITDLVLKDRKIYRLFRFYLKYENVFKEMRERIKLYKMQEKQDDARNKFLKILETADNEVGIVKVNDTENGISVFAGTKKEMMISNIVGKPFTKDMYEEGHYYGHYNDYYMPPRRVIKSFHQSDLTELHKKMIIKKKNHLKNLSFSKNDEIGYILCDNFSIIISRLKLTKAGIDPDTIGWKPLKLTIVPKHLHTIIEEHHSYDFMDIPISVRSEITKELIFGKK